MTNRVETRRESKPKLRNEKSLKGSPESEEMSKRKQNYFAMLLYKVFTFLELPPGNRKLASIPIWKMSLLFQEKTR